MAKQSTTTKVAETLGVAALAGAAAAAYLFTGSEGKKRQAKVKAWAVSAKHDLANQIKKMKTVSQKTYNQAATEVMAKYKTAKKIEPQELAAFGAELKKHWEAIAMQAKKLGKQSPAPKKSKAKKK